MTNLISKKTWANAAAFVEVDNQTGVVKVYGKWYDDRGKGQPGPSTDVLATLSPELLAQARKVTWRDTLSPELQAFCDEMWAKAKQEVPWFSY